MKTITVKFKEPKILGQNIIQNEQGQITQVVLRLDWYGMGIGIHRIYKKDGKIVWTDPQSPIPIRKFESVRDMMWEYELPQSLKETLENII
jgi:hypothetical protein